MNTKTLLNPIFSEKKGQEINSRIILSVSLAVAFLLVVITLLLAAEYLPVARTGSTFVQSFATNPELMVGTLLYLD
jgi:hypothetical protein